MDYNQSLTETNSVCLDFTDTQCLEWQTNTINTYPWATFVMLGQIGIFCLVIYLIRKL